MWMFYGKYYDRYTSNIIVNNVHFHFSEISKISNFFKEILLIQLIGSLGSQIFSLYVLQSYFYFTMVFAAASPIAQVFMYCYLGDLLTQKVQCSFYHISLIRLILF